MSDLICPKCERSGLRWLDPDMDDLIFKGIMECKNKGCKAQYTMEQFRQAWLDKHPPDPKDQAIADLRAELAEKERDINHLWQRDSVWRAKKEMLENDLAKAWERVERAERVWWIVGRMRERVLNRPPGVIIPMWVHDAIEEAEAVRGPEGEDERD